MIVSQESSEAAEAASAAAPAVEPAATPTVEDSPYIAKQKQRFGMAGSSSEGSDDDGTRVAIPAFFGKREEEKPGAARGAGGLNEQGYEPFDANALDSSLVDTRPVFIALAIAGLAISVISASNLVS